MSDTYDPYQDVSRLSRIVRKRVGMRGMIVSPWPILRENLR